MFRCEKTFEFDREGDAVEREEDVQVIDLASGVARGDGDPVTFEKESGRRFSKIIIRSEVIVEAHFHRFIAGSHKVPIVIKNDLREATAGAAEIDLVAVLPHFGNEGALGGGEVFVDDFGSGNGNTAQE